jgi:thiosulfate oxidation carrier complex protein SoxZ
MADTPHPIRMHASRKDATLQLKVLIQHPMHSGVARDEDGNVAAAHHITRIDLLINGQPRIQADIGPGVSRNPLFGWRLSGVKQGDEVTFFWQDNLGNDGRRSLVVG